MLSEKTPSRKDNVANRAIKGAKTCAYDFMIDVGMLSTGDDLPDIELISFNTSSTEGGFRVLKNSPVWRVLRISIQSVSVSV